MKAEQGFTAWEDPSSLGLHSGEQLSPTLAWVWEWFLSRKVERTCCVSRFQHRNPRFTCSQGWVGAGGGGRHSSSSEGVSFLSANDSIDPKKHGRVPVGYSRSGGEFLRWQTWYVLQNSRDMRIFWIKRAGKKHLLLWHRSFDQHQWNQDCHRISIAQKHHCPETHGSFMYWQMSFIFHEIYCHSFS